MKKVITGFSCSFVRVCLQSPSVLRQPLRGVVCPIHALRVVVQGVAWRIVRPAVALDTTMCPADLAVALDTIDLRHTEVNHAPHVLVA